MLGTILLGLLAEQVAMGPVGLAAYTIARDSAQRQRVWLELNTYHNQPRIPRQVDLPYLLGGPDDPNRPAPSPADPDEDPTGGDEPVEDAGLALLMEKTATVKADGWPINTPAVGRASVAVLDEDDVDTIAFRRYWSEIDVSGRPDPGADYTSKILGEAWLSKAGAP